jgi:Tol biopolymer transport system component
VYANNPDGSQKWIYNLGPSPGADNAYMPGVDNSGGPNDGTVYSDIAGDAVVAINPNGTFKWNFFMGADVDSTPVVGPDGTIYFGVDITDDGEFPLFAVNPNGTRKWKFLTGDDVDNTPALSPDGSVVYVVSNDGNLYAVDTTTGSGIWNFAIVTDTADAPANVTSSPAVDPSTGTIYVGSDDNKVYAINPDGTLKWDFTTGGKVKSSPAVGSDGTIFVGSDDTNVYALTPFDEEPRNLQGLLLTSADLGGTVDSATNWLNGAGTKGPWAVRLEVDRFTQPGGEGDYELRLWMKQCDSAICDTLNGALDPFFKDTRIIYNEAPNLVQSFQLDATKNAQFDRFIFGFTAASGADPIEASIGNFSLSFIRPGDPIITP